MGDRASLLPMGQLIEMRNKQRSRRDADVEITEKSEKELKSDNIQTKEKEEKKDVAEKLPRNPLKRTSIPFGGVIDDIKYRYKDYLSDIKDGFNPQVIAATIFIYFAALSGAIAFRGLMGSSTENQIGIPETLILSSVGGTLFALFAGCPLIITGTTGPVLLYDQALFSFCKDIDGLQFLPWRFWIGVWTFAISLIVAGFQGSTLVRFFTRFTKDIFNALVALLFIVSAFEKLGKIFAKHPLIEVSDYCEKLEAPCLEDLLNPLGSDRNTTCALAEKPDTPQPNTALMSMFLMLGTFFIAYFLRIFRTSQYFGKTARKAMGDFGVPIAIVIMVLIDFCAQDTYTEKLDVPTGISTTIPGRGWIISPAGTTESPLAIWAMFIAIIPALLLYLLLFMETHICELIMMEKTKEKKGAGLHWDIVLLSLINFICGVFGGPWICAATVRAVSHVSALTVTGVAVPGEPPKTIGVRDQRMSALTVSVLLLVSVALAPVLKLVPFAILFGVFLYMGVSGMNGVQFFDRIFLMLKPVKHHPPVSYVQKVRTWRMVLFTVLQAIGLAILWTVKHVKDEEMDFYESAAACPITPDTVAPLHRSIMGLVQQTTLLGFDMKALEQAQTKVNSTKA